jgi:hypothetical protein
MCSFLLFLLRLFENVAARILACRRARQLAVRKDEAKDRTFPMDYIFPSSDAIPPGWKLRLYGRQDACPPLPALRRSASSSS